MRGHRKSIADGPPRVFGFTMAAHPHRSDVGYDFPLVAEHPALGRRLRDERRMPRRYVNVYLDGAECRRLESLDTEIADGVEIQVIPSVTGG